VTPHTPGPWQWFGNTKNNDVYLSTVRGGRQFVMQFCRWGMASAQPEFQVDRRMVKSSTLVKYERHYRADFIGIDHPDAHLIAAAPELLEALRAVVRSAHPSAVDHPTMYQAWEQAAAAIAKAEGRQS
jgi:hypothetical protein